MASSLRRLETVARAGWLARGIVYCLLAYLAFTAAGSSQASPQGVFQTVRASSGGAAILTLLAVGLGFYGVYRLYSAAFDIESKGDNLKGSAIRTGYAASGLAHFILAYSAARLAMDPSEATDGAQEESAGRMLLDLPLGDAVLSIIGLAFLAAAAHQMAKAWKTDFVNELSPSAPFWAKPVGQIGLFARGVVFSVIGFSLIRAGWFQSADHVKGLGDALSSLHQHPQIYAFVALGLFMFGIHSVLDALWRDIRDEDMVDRLRA
ncbi:DUF1206 domain-containing protein [Microcoleus sp. F10-B2]